MVMKLYHIILAVKFWAVFSCSGRVLVSFWAGNHRSNLATLVRVTTDYRQLPTRVEHGVQINTETKYASTASTLRTHPRCCQHRISLGGLRNICRLRGSAQPNQRLVVVFYEYTHRSTTAGGHVRHGRDARSHTTDRCFTTQSDDPVRARTGRANPTRPPVRPAKRAASPQTRADRPLYESGYR